MISSYGYIGAQKSREQKKTEQQIGKMSWRKQRTGKFVREIYMCNRLKGERDSSQKTETEGPIKLTWRKIHANIKMRIIFLRDLVHSYGDEKTFRCCSYFEDCEIVDENIQ
jgi:hypothetical protein